jgi:trimeric autotransporter adhesin
MSTKTLRKRIALVAVSALGFGVISTAPSSAIESAAGVVTSIALTASSSTPGLNTATTISPKVTHGVLATAGDLITVKGVVLTKPTGSTGTIVTTAGTAIVAVAVAGATGAKSGVTYATTGASTSLFVNIATVANQGTNMVDSDSPSLTSLAGGEGTTGTPFGSFTFAGDTAGSYTLRVWNDATANGINDAGEVYQDIVIAVTAATLTDFANAAATTACTNGGSGGLIVSAVGVTKVGISGRVGVGASFAPNFTVTNNFKADGTACTASTNTNAQSANLAYSVTNPAGTAVAVTTASAGTTASTEQYVTGATETLVSGVSSATSTKGSTVYFATATAGTYSITVYHDANRDDLVSAGEAATSATIVVVADGLPSITFTKFGQSDATTSAASAFGQLVKVSLRNGTAATTLAANETLTLTGPALTVFDMISVMGTSLAMTDTGASNSTTQALTAANFNGAGDAYVNIGNTTAAGGTFTITATVTGGTASGANGSFSITVLDATTYARFSTVGAVTNAKALLGVYGADLATGDAAKDWFVKAGVSTAVSVGMVYGANQAKSFQGLVTDTLGLITGVAGAKYNVHSSGLLTGAVTASATALGVTIPATTVALPTGTTVATLAIDKNTAGTITIKTQTAAPLYSYSDPTNTLPSYSLRAAVASSNTVSVLVTDQFGNVMPNVTVSGVIAGRNSTTVIPALFTNASGMVSYTLADVYTGTLALVDTVTFTPGGVTAAASSFVVNYATYLPTATITMTTPDSAAATASGITGVNTTDINAADGANLTTAAISVVLKDANGATQPAGIPVVFTVTGNTGAGITSTKVTVYTTSAGAAATTVYSTLNGNATITATSGAITASGVVYFKQADAVSGVQAEARTITAKATGNVVTATVTDRYGNPIKGINVVASRVGTGTFNGTSSLTGVTDKAGSVDFVLTNGTADVTVGFETATFGQSAATKGYLDAGVTALTATVAGTISLAAVGVGASSDAAGVNSVTVKAVADTATIDQAAAATDAAAEATDAANAATDAANAAAEAADAATAAAQDAADAVAALSTQVSEMVNALKKQITALTNLVIKIQKKVRA